VSLYNSAFFAPVRSLNVAQVAELVGANLHHPALGEVEITAFAPLDNAGPGALTFIEGKRHLDLLQQLVAAACLCPPELASKVPANVAVLISSHPQRDFSALGRLLFPQSVHPLSSCGEAGLSPHAHIHDSVELEEEVTIEAGAVIGKNVEIGRGSVIGAGTVIGENCKIGRDCYFAPGVSVQYAFIGNRVRLYAGVRIGQDGFGYIGGAQGIEKIPQLGRVILQDDVEIGANSTIDRGALSDTIIGEGTKIDNLVQIAHNVRIGRFCLIAAQCGLAGSCSVGDGTQIGGATGIADHIKIGAHVQIAATSGVMNDIPDGEKWGGSPARPFKQWFREVAALRSMSRNHK